METTIASLEAELAGKCREGEEAILRNETLALELEILSDKFKRSHIELNMLQEEVSGLVSFSVRSLLLLQWSY